MNKEAFCGFAEISNDNFPPIISVTLSSPTNATISETYTALIDSGSSITIVSQYIPEELKLKKMEDIS